jgi:hypothetical protein
MEFAPLIKMLFPAWLYRITFFGLLFLLQITNIGSIVISAQTMDYTAMTIAGKTCAVTMYSRTWAGASVPSTGTYTAGDSSVVHPIFQCIVSSSNSSSTKDSVFGEDYVVSLGFIIVAIIVTMFVISITFTALIVTELFMVAIQINRWHFLMVSSSAATLLTRGV